MLNVILEWSPQVGGLYLMYIAVIMKTQNAASSIVFKFVPLVLSIRLLIVAANTLGLVVK